MKVAELQDFRVKGLRVWGFEDFGVRLVRVKGKLRVRNRGQSREDKAEIQKYLSSKS